MDQVSRHSFIMTGFGPRHASTGASSIELASSALLGLTLVSNFSFISICRLQFLRHVPALLPYAYPGFFLNITSFQHFSQHTSTSSRSTRFKHALSIGSPVPHKAVPTRSSPLFHVLDYTSTMCSNNNRTSPRWFELTHLHPRHVVFVSSTLMVFSFDTTRWQLKSVSLDTTGCDQNNIKLVSFTLPDNNKFILHYCVPLQFLTAVSFGFVLNSKKQSPRGLPKQKQTRRSRALTYNLNSEKQSPR